MPNLDTVIPEITKQVIEPVSEQIAKRLLMIMGLSQLFTNNLFITSDDLKASNFNDDDHNKRVSANRCDVEIVPNYNPAETAFENFKGKDTEAHASSNRWTFGEYPIFHDKRADIYLHEIVVPCSVELNFTLKLKSIELADLASSALYSRALSTDSVFSYNDVLFSYGFPDRLLIILYKLYKMQDDITGEMSFPEYLTFGSNSRIRTLANRHNLDNKELIVERANIRVLGKLSYTGDKPDAESVNKVADRYTIQFKYTYQFSRPTLLKINYPIMINNKLIDYRFIRYVKGTSLGEGPRHFTEQCFNAYFENINLKYPSYTHIQYPLYDDWMRSPVMYSNINTNYPAIFTGMMSVSFDQDTGDRYLSINIRDEIFPLLPIEMAHAIEDVLVNDTNGDIFKRLSIFDIEVFSNDQMIDLRLLSIDEHLNLTINIDPDITKRYHIVIGQCNNIRLLNAEYIYYMLNRPEVCNVLLTTINMGRYIDKYLLIDGELVLLTEELAISLLNTTVSVYCLNYYTNFLSANLNYLIKNKYVNIVTDLFTNQKSITFYRQYIQSAQNTNGGYHHGPCRAIIVGRYIIEVRNAR